MSTAIAVKPEPAKILLWEPKLCGVKCEPVTKFDDDLKALVGKMMFTMRAYNGIGLAAPQIGVFLNLALVHDLSDETRNHVWVLVNPKILEQRGTQVGPEGCLSIPGRNTKGNVYRHDWIKFEYWDVEGERVEMECDGMQSVVVQHETNHLEGRFFIDHLGRLKRGMVLKSYKKWERENSLEFAVKGMKRSKR